MSKKQLNRKGTVQSFNFSPKGSYEGLLLKTADEIIQVNFPREHSEQMSAFAPEGSELRVALEAWEESKGPAEHPVYRLGSASNGKGEEFPGAQHDGSFSGKISRLNYALHGEVNGGVLDSGDFLHLKPHGAAALKIRVGLHVKGVGSSKPMPGGGHVIEAEEVNGIRLEKKPGPRKKAHHA